MGRAIGSEQRVLGAGRHLVPLTRLGVRAPGVYLAQLRHQGRTQTKRVVVR